MCVTDGGREGGVHHETDRVVLDIEEAERIAGQLEELYYLTEADPYEITSDDAAEDAMMLRTRGGIEPNPELIGDE